MFNKLLTFSTLIFLFLFTQINLTGQVVINEINYHSADDFDTKDWLEFHNTGNSLVNIGDWYFSDDNDANNFTFPAGTTIEANGFLVVCRNIDSFSLFWPQVLNYVGEFEFGLNNGGELIRLFNASGTLVDTVHYDDESPWPVEPDGGGLTLQLLDPSQDNADAQYWFAATGTPGAPNVPNSTKDPGIEVSVEISPNPVQHTAYVRLRSSQEILSGKLVIFDQSGHRFQELPINEMQDINLDTSDYPPGFYTLRIWNADGRLSPGTKFVVIR
jgi:hypothetical protein